MAGRIPRAFIDELLSRVDIVDVIDARVPLKKQGSNWAACCPFHDEKTPSFTVSPTKQFYYCFGCGASGSAIGFLMEYERMDFVEAIETLASGLGIEVPREGGAPREGHDALYQVMDSADRYYREQLRQSRRAVDYLKQRGLSGNTAARFGLGWAPPGWTNLIEHLAQTDPRHLLQAGLVNRKEDSGRTYDRFRERIMFPIRDRRGRTIAFGGRVVGDDEPKYLNSPETPLFHKGRELYGLYEARKARRELPRLVVVEGYMDVVMLAEHDIDYAVATLGTSVGEAHIERLFSTSPEIVFCFDGDNAGRQAAWRALTNTLPVLQDGREARFLFLPEGEDPDSVVRAEGREAFEARLEQALPLADFLVERLRAGIDTTSEGGRARLAAEARPLFRRMPQGVYRDLLTERLATEVGLSADRLRADLDRGESDERSAPEAAQVKKAPSAVHMNPIRTAIALVLQFPQLARSLPDDHPVLSSQEKGASILRKLREQILEDPETNAARLLEPWRDTSELPHLQRLAGHDFPGLDEDESNDVLERTFRDALQRIAEDHIRSRYDALLAATRERALSEEEKREFQSLLVDLGR